MTKSNTTIVTTAVVRKAFADGSLDASAVLDAKGNPVSTASLFGKNGDGNVRGRIHPAFVAAFVEANPGTEFAERVPTVKTVTIVPTRLDSKGRTRKLAAREVPLSEVRVMVGASKAGRLSQADLDKAAEILGAK